MISDSKPSNLPHENLYRNVSMNMLSLTPSDIRHLYEEVSTMMGVYTRRKVLLDAPYYRQRNGDDA